MKLQDLKKMVNTIYNKKIDYITVNRIANGFTVSVNNSWLENGNDRWDSITYYCENLHQVNTKLEEIFNEK